MTRHLLIFILTFAAGALIAVILRTAMHHPHAGPGEAAPVDLSEIKTERKAEEKAEKKAEPAPPASSTATTVNTICPGCGDPVNPAIPTAEYQGKTIGFNCAMCPKKFAAEPTKYGEAALKNIMAENP